MFEFTAISVIIFIATVINSVVSYISWQRRKTQSGMYFSLGMMGVTLWTLAAALDYAAVPLSLKILFAKIEPIGYLSALSLFALFALSYAGYDEWVQKKWVRAVFVLIPIINVLLIATNELHGWVWTGFEKSANNVYIFKHGPGFPWVAGTSHLLTVIIIINLWLASRKGSEISRRQGRLLLYAILFPLAANLVYLFGIEGVEGVDWTSVTFSVTGLLFLRALYGQKLLDITPIAREKLIRNLGDGMIVLDMQDRIIDINQAAAAIMATQPAEVLGKKLVNVAPPSRSFLEQPPEQEIKSEIETGNEKKQYFDLLISPLREGPKKIIGRLIILRDITRRKENELRLIQLTQDLQEAQAQVVEQQRTLAKLEERQRMGRDMHDSVNQSIHSIIMFSETLSALLQKNRIENALAISERIQESSRQALKEIRLLVYEAQSIFADENASLTRALEERLNMVERRGGIQAEVIYQNISAEDWPSAWNENLYWLIMEALNNALKHARARSVRIFFTRIENQMEIKIEDDGTGFDTSQIQSGGWGTRTMRERAEILGGQLRIQSSPQNGTRIYFNATIEV